MYMYIYIYTNVYLSLCIALNEQMINVGLYYIFPTVFRVLLSSRHPEINIDTRGADREASPCPNIPTLSLV